MIDDTIYGIMAEVTGHEKEYMMLGHETQMVRPSEVVEIVRKVIGMGIILEVAGTQEICFQCGGLGYCEVSMGGECKVCHGKGYVQTIPQ